MRMGIFGNNACRWRTAVSLLLLAALLPLRAQPYRQRMPLAGTWQTELGTVVLPGTTDTNRRGTPLADTTETTHLSRRYSYVGRLAYTSEVTIPQTWRKKRILLHIERTKPTILLVDGKTAGTSDDISTGQTFDLTGSLSTGRHQLTILVDNTPDAVPPQLISSSHAYTEDTQTNWNGILGDFHLEAVPLVHISNISITPHAAARAFSAIVSIEGKVKKKTKLKVILAKMGDDYGRIIAHSEITDNRQLLISYQSDSLQCWDEFHPTLYRLIVEIEGHDEQEKDFGLCDFKASGTQFAVNGQTTFLRGKHDACVFPYTGHVPTDLASWRHYLQVCKGYGINHIRFHSWCPPEAAFMAADIEGVYMQPELPFWGDFKKEDSRLMTFLHKEGINILRHYGHHPSFVMMALGNELWGDIPTMKRFTDDFRRIAPDKLYTFGSNYYLGYQGWQEGMDYFTTCRNGGEAWGSYNTHTRGSFSFCDAFDGGIINHFSPNSSMNFDEAVAQCPVPIISHETGQFQTFPDFQEIRKYTGTLRPCNLETFQQRLAQHGMADQAEAFHQASGRWSVQLYKADIEMDLRTRGLAGFQLLDLQDYPGQGSAYVGILDAFMESKDITTPEEWRQWCNDVVPLMVWNRYTWDTVESPNEETACIWRGTIKVANYSGKSLRGKRLTWIIRHEDGTFHSSDTLRIETDSTGLFKVADVAEGICNIQKASRMNLELRIEGTPYHNTYPMWVYPTKARNTPRKGIVITPEITDEIGKKLERGATVLLMPDSTTGSQASSINSRLLVGGLFQTDYWNYRMFKTISENNKKPVSPGTLGILTHPGHALFRDFPTDAHTNWQWFPIIKASHPFILDNTPAEYRPIVQVIDNVERNHKLGLVFEFRVGKGKLLVCMSPLHQLQDHMEARQFYTSLLNYMESPDFAPKTAISSAELRQLLTTPVEEGQMKKLFNISQY